MPRNEVDRLIQLSNQLGTYKSDENKYLKEPDCLQTLRLISKELQNDDSFNTARQDLFRIDIISHDIIHLISQHVTDGKNFKEKSSQEKLFSVLIRILLNLTQKTEDCFKENELEEGGNRNPRIVAAKRFIELSRRQLKKSFINLHFWQAMYKKMFELMSENEDEQNKENEEPDSDEDPFEAQEKLDRQRQRKLEFERILLFMRNLLSIQLPEKDQKQVDGNSNLQDELVTVIEEANILKLFLFMVQNEQYDQWALHILEILVVIFKNHVSYNF